MSGFPLAPPVRLTEKNDAVRRDGLNVTFGYLLMSKSTWELPTAGYAIVIDGRIKTEFTTKEGAQTGARDLKRRFPMLQIKVYDAEARSNEEVLLA